jgi:hypothetical protein
MCTFGSQTPGGAKSEGMYLLAHLRFSWLISRSVAEQQTSLIFCGFHTLFD